MTMQQSAHTPLQLKRNRRQGLLVVAVTLAIVAWLVAMSPVVVA